MPDIETVSLPIDSLRPHPQNARTHDLPRIKQSLERLGQFRTIVVQAKVVRHKRTILAGHGTWEAAKELGFQTLMCGLVAVDNATARRIVLADNHSGDDAGYDPEKLSDLLQSLGDDFGGTGYEPDDLKSLLAKLAGPSAEPVVLAQTYEVIVKLPDEAAQVELLERLTAEGLSCRALL